MVCVRVRSLIVFYCRQSLRRCVRIHAFSKCVQSPTEPHCVAVPTSRARFQALEDRTAENQNFHDAKEDDLKAIDLLGDAIAAMSAPRGHGGGGARDGTGGMA